MILFAASVAELEKVFVTQRVDERNPTTGKVTELRSTQPDFAAIDALPSWRVDDVEDLIARAMDVDPAAAARELSPLARDESHATSKLSSAAVDAIRSAGAAKLGGLDVAAHLENGRGLYVIDD